MKSGLIGLWLATLVRWHELSDSMYVAHLICAAGSIACVQTTPSTFGCGTRHSAYLLSVELHRTHIVSQASREIMDAFSIGERVIWRAGSRPGHPGIPTPAIVTKIRLNSLHLRVLLPDGSITLVDASPWDLERPGYVDADPPEREY